jgi:hypothetical protein
MDNPPKSEKKPNCNRSERQAGITVAVSSYVTARAALGSLRTRRVRGRTGADSQRAGLMRAGGGWHGPAGFGVARCRQAPRRREVRPEGSHSGISGARLGPCARAGGGWVGRLPLAAAFRVWWACPGTSAAALGPGPALVSALSSAPAFLGRPGRSVGRVSVPVSELGRPLDDEPAGRPGWVGILLSPYTAGNQRR